MAHYQAPLPPTPPPPPPLPSSKKKHSPCPPQKALDEHWRKFITKTPGKITRIFPPSLYANLLPRTFPETLAGNISATASYEAAKKACELKVKRIVRECRRTNEKWSDPDFDIESDFSHDIKNCLDGLADNSDYDEPSNIDSQDLRSALSTLNSAPGLFHDVQSVSTPELLRVLNNSSSSSSSSSPWTAASVHRVSWIYTAPQFTINGFGVSDVQQGSTGDCWWVAAVATLCGASPGAVERVCVARDEECGVYGFVFHRDGAWCPVVVDDNLYLACPDYDVYSAGVYDPTGRKARRHKERHQTGSEALAFAKCTNQNETWLPLLEKAYAKCHGDYAAIEDGFAGEGVEDLTGGVTTSVDTNKVLSKDRLWGELLNPKGEFIFGTGTPVSASEDSDSRSGLTYRHAYSVLKAVEEKDVDGKSVKLVQIRYLRHLRSPFMNGSADIKMRNPWGKRNEVGDGEWNGPWSDGSKEWNAYWLNKLNHKFGDDGVFWISYDDMLSRFDQLDRTRLFGEGWRVVQQWTSINVSWITGYINTKFVVEVKEAGLFVLVLSKKIKLDDRYFKGLQGMYDFELHFILKEPGSEVGDHIARVRPSRSGRWQRAISAEVELDPGTYEVYPKILATKNNSRDSVEEIVKAKATKNPQKLRQIGLNYDFAHLKAVPPPKGVSEETTEATAKPEQEAGQTESDDKTEMKKTGDTAKQDPTPEARKEDVPVEEVKGEASTEAATEEAPTEGGKEDAPAEKAKEEAPTEAAKDKAPTEAAKEEPPAEAAQEDAPTDPTDDSKSQPPEAKSSEPADPKPAQGAAEPPAKAPEESEVAKGAPKAAEEAPDAAKAPETPIVPDEPQPKPDVAAAAAEDTDSDSDLDDDGAAWNAVCVIGLRVYGKDAEMAIRLEAPGSDEEGAALDVDGEPTGGTM